MTKSARVWPSNTRTVRLHASARLSARTTMPVRGSLTAFSCAACTAIHSPFGFTGGTFCVEMTEPPEKPILVLLFFLPET